MTVSHPYRGRIHPLLAALAALLLCWGCAEQPETVFQGYVEGEFVRVAAPLAGQLAELHVRRGAQVAAGDPLFALESEQEQAALAAAAQEVLRAESRLADLRKGQRPSELRALEARLTRSRAALALAEQEFARRQKLAADDAVAVEELDRAATALERARADRADAAAMLETARLGARGDLVAAAQAELAAAVARRDQAQWALDQKSRRAAQGALVFDTLFEPGEFVPAGTPVVSLLPPANLRIRFFVPEPLIGTLRIGQPVRFAYDGSGGAREATVTFISPRAEYTPPVIYSLETRSKLVFMVEATPAGADPSSLHPGQPVDVRPESPRG